MHFTSYQIWASQKQTVARIDTLERTKVFESIQTIGPGKLTTECDGIPRFSFYGTPTITTNTTYIVTQTSYLTRLAPNPTVSPWERYDPSPRKPKCKLNPRSCDRIYGYDSERRGPVLAGELDTTKNSLWVGLTGCGA